MATIALTAESFQEIALGEGIVFVDFWADWCAPCRMFGPVFEAASGKHPDVVFGKVDTEAEQGLAGALNIRSIPTLMAFRDGVLVFAQPGALPETALEEVIQDVRGLDMEEVHREIEDRETATAGTPS
jgi:thioredoxin 1